MTAWHLMVPPWSSLKLFVPGRIDRAIALLPCQEQGVRTTSWLIHAADAPHQSEEGPALGSSPGAAGSDSRAGEEVLHGQRGALAGGKALQGGGVGRTRPGMEPAAGGILHSAKLRLCKAQV